MPPLRIVLVTIEPPLPFGDAAARWFYVLVKGLTERGHRVTTFSACSRPHDIEKARALFPSREYDLRLYPFAQRGGWRSKRQTIVRPFSYMFSPELKRDLDGVLAGGFDVLHLEQLWSGWLGLAHVDRALVSVHYLASIDLAERRPKSVREAFDRWLIVRTQRQLVRRLHFFRTVSTRLEEPLHAVNPTAVVRTVPLGLDLSLYEYITDENRTASRTLALIGSMAWEPSHSAAVRLLLRLWPGIKRRVPDARLDIVGWSAREKLAGFLQLPDVNIEENVPDIRPYFERASVLLYAPGPGSGMKVKIQEAMAFGVPVVTTSEGIEGLSALDGVHAGVCEDDAGLIERAVVLLESPDAQNRQRRAARELLEAECGPRPVLDRLEAVYSELLGRR